MVTKTIIFLSGLVALTVASTEIKDNLAIDYPNNTRRIPQIKAGQKCIKGQVYRMDCNTCHCGANSRLLCTKMACLGSFNNIPTTEKVALSAGSKSCTPGKLYTKGCQKCFCTQKAKIRCSDLNCKLAERTALNPEDIQPMASADFYKLPSLPHRGVPCSPGATYRIDCNTCFCLESGNLMCQQLLCPSYDDVSRLNAKEINGRPCEANASIVKECIECQCKSGQFACETKPECQHSDGRRMMHGEYPSTRDRNFIDTDKMKEDCKPGMVYKVHCNKCYCQNDGSLRCTQKSCLNFSQIEQLRKLKDKLDREEGSS